jgi:hypothetical protein
MGLARLSRRQRGVGATVILALSIGMSLVYSPRAGIPRLAPGAAWYYGTPTEDHVRALHDAVRLVPDGVPVAATNKVGSHLSECRYFFTSR